MLLFGYFSSAQQIYHFKEALYLPISHNNGCEAIYSEEFIWNYYIGTVMLSKAGQNIQGEPATEQLTWIQLEVDTSSFFRPSPRRGGDLRNPNNPIGLGRIERVSTTRADQDGSSYTSVKHYQN